VSRQYPGLQIDLVALLRERFGLQTADSLGIRQASDLIMRFLVDNQLPPILAGWLCDRGHDAIHSFDAGLARLDDRALWAHAIAEGRVVISKNEDFLYLANQSAPRSSRLVAAQRLGDANLGGESPHRRLHPGPPCERLEGEASGVGNLPGNEGCCDADPGGEPSPIDQVACGPAGQRCVKAEVLVHRA
jgi:Domain of unknown function (DUF5615)